MRRLKTSRPFILLSFVVAMISSIFLILGTWLVGVNVSSAENYKEEALHSTLSEPVEQAVKSVDDKVYWKAIDQKQAEVKVEQAKLAKEAQANKKKTRNQSLFST